MLQGSPDGRRARAVSALVVLLTNRGVVLPRSESHAEVLLTPPDLDLLARLATPEARELGPLVAALAADWSIDPAVPTELVRRLDERGLLTEAPATPAPPLAAAPTTSDPRPGIADASLVVGAPRMLGLRDGAFVVRDHAGDVTLRLGADELTATVRIAERRTVAEAQEHHASTPEGRGSTLEDVERLATRLVDAGVLFPAAEVQTTSRAHAMMQAAILRAMKSWAAVDVGFQAQLREGIAADDARGARRIPVVPLASNHGAIPLSLGMLMSHAEAFEGGRLADDYLFLPVCLMDGDRLAGAIERDGIFLFSDYIWSHAENLESSFEIKRRNPGCIVVHGGPDAPKYPGDVEAYLAANPYIDVVVHGEGEVTFVELLAALAPSVRAGAARLDDLADVAGLTYRSADGPVRTADRERLSDVNVVPSPYLAGVYDLHAPGIDTAFIETNRGCPYGCTYCDWGSSTNSRIRKFDLDRVFAELEWCARAGVERIYVADANFGIFERDVAIAEKVAELKRRYGVPNTFQTNYAKNTVKHLQKIVSVLAAEGIVTEGLLSLQSMDDDTLAAIRRSNIKVDKYDSLAAEFRRAELPLMVDLMVGLPGSTTRSVREDFQQCIDREINAKVFQTELLINSPMNEPSYRDEHRIVVERSDGRPAERVPTRGAAGGGRSLVVSSASFTRSDYDEMLGLRRAFLVTENFAALRLVARFLRQEKGVHESDLLEGLRSAAYDAPDRWPTISATIRYTPEYMVPPVSWGAFIDEVGRFLGATWDLPSTSGLRSVLIAQHAVLPSPGRRFPFAVDLPHDVGAWYADVRRAKDAGHRTTWPDHVARLATYPATTFVVEDPNRVCDVGLGFSIDADPYADWELESTVRRAHARHAPRSDGLHGEDDGDRPRDPVGADPGPRA